MRGAWSLMLLAALPLPVGCSRGVTSAAEDASRLRVVGRAAVHLGLLLPDAASNEHVFELRNEAGETVGISVTDVSCACAKARLDHSELLPGQSAFLAVAVRSNQPGVKQAQVTVLATSSGDRGALVRVAVEAVVAGMTIEPETVRLTATSQASASLEGEARLKVYTSDAEDWKQLAFSDLSAGQGGPPMQCTFGAAVHQAVPNGAEIVVPLAFSWDVQGSPHPPTVHYRDGVIKLAKDEHELETKFLAWIEPPQDYRLQPEALVIRVTSQGDGTATGEAGLRVVASEGVPELDDLSVHSSLETLAVEVNGASVTARYRGSAILQPVSAEIRLSSTRLPGGERKVSVLLLAHE